MSQKDKQFCFMCRKDLSKHGVIKVYAQYTYRTKRTSTTGLPEYPLCSECAKKDLAVAHAICTGKALKPDEWWKRNINKIIDDNREHIKSLPWWERLLNKF